LGTGKHGPFKKVVGWQYFGTRLAGTEKEAAVADWPCVTAQAADRCASSSGDEPTGLDRAQANMQTQSAAPIKSSLNQRSRRG
jgi:hypothetical protein